VKVAVSDYIEDNLDWEAGEMKRAGIGFAAHQLKFKPEDEVAAALADADVIVVNMVKMTEPLLRRLPKCRLLIRHGIGYDNVDVGACTRLGIQFAYQPDYCREDVAEHAIALIMACARKVVWSRRTLDAASRSGRWDFSGLFPIYRMEGKTLGIIGVGRIGSRVAARLGSFGFRIVGCDPYLTARRRKQVGIEFVDLETLCRTADLITLHTPLNDETRHIINAASLAWMKPTAYLVNTSRGPMIETAALVDALRNGRLAGAAVDVFDVEPPPADHPLFGLDNVILTPHIGWASEESGWVIRRRIVEDILLFARGRPAKYVVNREVPGGKKRK
jgi:D-3-phosphoglycerate dehydrogenase